MYIYVYICICICVYVYVCMYIHKFTCIHKYIYIHIYIYVYIYVNTDKGLELRAARVESSRTLANYESNTVDFEGFVACKLGGLRDHMCTTGDLKLNV